MIKVANIVGARPQFIKYFPVSKAIQSAVDRGGSPIHDILIHTGQHYDYSMSKVFFDEFGIKDPAYHLEVGSGTHGEQTAQVIQKVEEVLFKEKPDVVMIYGDTNSTLGGAVASSKNHIPVIHIEAGLRSYNKYMPEEINRVLADHASTLLLCPSKTAVMNLMREGLGNVVNEGMLIPQDYFHRNRRSGTADKNNPSVINVGDVMYDVLLHSLVLAKTRSVILDSLHIEKSDYSLLTIHRAENTDNKEKFMDIMQFVRDVSPGNTVIFPMHPRTKKLYDSLNKKFADNVKAIEPVGYFDILTLLENSSFLMTDSGGMQKEAYWLNVPCVTLREETEWTETVESGWNVLHKNFNGINRPKETNAAAYGDGKAGERIIDAMAGELGLN